MLRPSRAPQHAICFVAQWVLSVRETLDGKGHCTQRPDPILTQTRLEILYLLLAAVEFKLGSINRTVKPNLAARRTWKCILDVFRGRKQWDASEKKEKEGRRHEQTCGATRHELKVEVAAIPSPANLKLGEVVCNHG